MSASSGVRLCINWISFSWAVISILLSIHDHVFVCIIHHVRCRIQLKFIPAWEKTNRKKLTCRKQEEHGVYGIILHLKPRKSIRNFDTFYAQL